MPDITMCYGNYAGLACPRRKICHRATATPSDFRQAYLAELPWNFKTESCRFFNPNGLHDDPDCPCGHQPGTRGPCGGCNCADQP